MARREFIDGKDLDLSQVPAVVTFENNGARRININMSGMNQQMPIEAGQQIKLRAETSSELIGFLSQETDELAVDFAKAE